ncbi:MAG: YdcF family protein [Trueperaceae bacterium]|nr:YdcF family protein [Trueperaceae bacterium]
MAVLAALVLFVLYEAGAILLFPQVSKLTCKADTILVMGAAQYNGVPSPAFQRRLDKALDLYNQGCGKNIVVTGGSQVGDNYSEGLTGAAYLYGAGVPISALTSETRSTTSLENLEFSKSFIPEQTVTIVTDDLHAYRTWYLAKHLGYSAEVVGVFAPYGRWIYGIKELVKITVYHLGFFK